MCDCCVAEHKGRLLGELADEGGFGVCSVRGCDIPGDVCDNPRYIDFKPELIHPLTREQLQELYPDHKSLDQRIIDAKEQLPFPENLNRTGRDEQERF